jgi:hypothetical protein
MTDGSYLRGGKAAHTLQHLIAVFCLGSQSVDGLVLLVDDGHLLSSAKGALNQGVLFIIIFYMSSKSIATLGIPQRLCHVLTYEEDLALLVGHRSDRSEKFVIENLYIFHFLFII